MKKGIKMLLIGAGITVAGLAVYDIFKEKETRKAKSEDLDIMDDFNSASDSAISKKWAEDRKEQIPQDSVSGGEMKAEAIDKAATEPYTEKEESEEETENEVE